MPISRDPASRRSAPRTYTIRPKRTYASRLSQTAQLRREPRIKPNKVLGVALLLLGVVLVVTHQAEHAGALNLMPGNWEDLLIGFPMAGVLFLASFIAFIWK